jgi:hypothetical protein
MKGLNGGFVLSELPEAVGGFHDVHGSLLLFLFLGMSAAAQQRAWRVWFGVFHHFCGGRLF